MEGDNKIQVMILACMRGDMEEVVRLVVEHGADNIINVNTSGITPLLIACRYNKVAVAKYLLENGAKIQTQKGAKYLPLLDSAALGNIQIVELLLKHGANINQHDEEEGAENTDSLACAIERGHEEMAKYLIRNGANINKPAFRDEPPYIIRASAMGMTEVVELLLEKGANIEEEYMKWDRGARPVHTACMGAKEETLRFLISKGAKVDVATTAGIMPLHYAIGHCSVECVRLLLQAGAPIDICTTHAKMPLSPDYIAEFAPFKTFNIDNMEFPTNISQNTNNEVLLRLFI